MWGSGPGNGLGQAWSWKSEAGQLDIETIFSNEYQLPLCGIICIISTEKLFLFGVSVPAV